MYIEDKNNEAISFKDFKIILILTGFIVITMAFGTLTAQKITVIGKLTTPGSSIWFTLITFPVMQTICTIYNKKFANFAIFAGWISMLTTTILAQLTALMPSAPVFEVHSKTFSFLLSSSLRYFIAASFSFGLTHLIGNSIFSRIKFTKYLWLKSLIVTTLSQFVNTAILIVALYAGTTSWNNLGSMFLGTILVRLCLVPIVVVTTCIGSAIVKKIKTLKREAPKESNNLISQRINNLRRILTSFF